MPPRFLSYYKTLGTEKNVLNKNYLSSASWSNLLSLFIAGGTAAFFTINRDSSSKNIIVLKFYTLCNDVL